MESGGGEITVFWAVVGFAMIIVAGFVVDGGAQIRAVQRAQFVAGEAARYGAQEVVGPAAVRGEGAVVDPEAAQAAAEYYLERMPDVDGTVTVVDGQVVVNTTCSKQTMFLGIIGRSQVSGTGYSEVDLVRAAQGVAR